ncbi:MAG TPA: hypothetical protein VN541_01485 [Tepidisphaeraceae bacterium]|nr:hypothetical protein [Tepidisphaeraceae bacterium]
MIPSPSRPQIYDRDGDLLMQESTGDAERLILVPDAPPAKVPDPRPRIRIMWGQHLLDDLVAGRYRSLVCAVNAQDNSRGVITQLAAFLPTSQWDEQSITNYARQFDTTNKVKVLKYDMDTVEVLAVLRPAGRTQLALSDLGTAFETAAQMIRANTARLPAASVSFLEARANVLVDQNGRTPSFEAVLRTMYEAGFTGDVYPSPSLWHAAPTGVFARYPFSPALDARREGGY